MNLRWLARLALVASCTVASGAQAQQTVAAEAGEGFTLTDALTVMRRAHPALAAARATNRAAAYDVVTAGLWTNPAFIPNYNRSLTSFTSYDPQIGYAQAGFSQLVELTGLPVARRRAAEHDLGATRAESLGVLLGLTLDVSLAMLELRAALERLEIQRHTAAQLERAGQIVRARVEAGAAPAYDASRIAIAVADVRAAVAIAEAEAIAARGELNVAVGPEAGVLQGPARIELYARPPLPPMATLREWMLAARPDLLAARARARAGAARIDVARRAVFQGITVYAGGAVGAGFGDMGQRQVDWSVVLTIPLPIVDRGQGTIPAAEARADALGFVAQELEIAAEQRLAATVADLLQRRRALEAFLQAGTAQSDTVIRQAEVAYREGHLSVLELVDAYQSVRDARLRLVTLAAEAGRGEIILWRVVGVAPSP